MYSKKPYQIHSERLLFFQAIVQCSETLFIIHSITIKILCGRFFGTSSTSSHLRFWIPERIVVFRSAISLEKFSSILCIWWQKSWIEVLLLSPAYSRLLTSGLEFSTFWCWSVSLACPIHQIQIFMVCRTFSFLQAVVCKTVTNWTSVFSCWIGACTHCLVFPASGCCRICRIVSLACFYLLQGRRGEPGPWHWVRSS